MAKQTKNVRRTKPRPKHIKSKVHTSQINSKRRRQRLGKERKAGMGEKALYISRTRALRKLQLSIKDFRRLCILKGIYPREPSKRKAGSGTGKAYYHVKDISYLAHEPLLKKFHEIKVFMKKVAHALNRKERDVAIKKYEKLPTYRLDHLIQERYPQFSDALADMDDALSMIHLFAYMPAGTAVREDKTTASSRLAREWQGYVVRSRSLKKVFVTIKGIYYQAEVGGQPITWLVPHQFTQHIPRDVDFRIMSTFLEFYIAFMRFVHFKLYHDLGMEYPPVLREDLENAGAHLTALAVKKKNIGDDSDEEEQTAAGNGKAPGKVPQEKMQSLEEKLAAMTKSDAFQSLLDPDTESEEEDSDEEEEDDEFEVTEEVKQMRQEAKLERQFRNLFKGCVFFLSREVPRDSLEFVISCFGGRVGYAGPGSAVKENDPSITHVITDRPNILNEVEGREYVQPQWVYDSVNARILLPVSKYAVGAELPPHLSPFVDDVKEGYIPSYRQELDRLRAAAGAIKSGDLSLADDELEGESAGEESEDEESEEEKEEEESEEEAESDEEEEDMEDAVGDDEDEVDDAEEEEESDEDAEEDDADEEETAEALGFVDEDSDDEAERLLSQTSSKTQPRKRQRVNSNGKQETRGAAAAEVKKAAKFEDALKTVKPKPQQKLTRKERRALQRQEEAEQKKQEEIELRESMLTNNRRNLYKRVLKARQRDQAAIDRLKEKRELLEGKSTPSKGNGKGKKRKSQ